MKVLVLGDGLLGSEIVKQSGWKCLSRKQDNIDIIEFTELAVLLANLKPDVIVNCIGYTNTYDVERENHWKINYEFVANLVDMCDGFNIKLVHISTDYIYANAKGVKDENCIPVHQQTWYSYCKLLADGYVQLRSRNYLMLRCSFKPKPFPYDNAYGNVKGNFDYVDVIAKQMIDLILEDRQGVWNIGTIYKSMYDLAVQTKPNVGYMYNELLPIIEMDLSKYNKRMLP